MRGLCKLSITALIMLLVATSVLTACGRNERKAEEQLPVGGQVITHTIRTPDGRERTFRLFVPASVAARPDVPAPLLIALHGGMGSAAQFEASSGFDLIAATDRFIVAYPDGLGAFGTDTLATWNGGICCGFAAREQVDDVRFISNLIDSVEATQSVNPNRVFAAGHSNGAFMAYRLACELSEKIVAIGVQAGGIGTDNCRPQLPVSAIQIHGSEDDHVPLAGGPGTRSVSGVNFPVPVEAAQTLAAADGCVAPPKRTELSAPTKLTEVVWQRGCRAGTEVKFVVVYGASHAWMGVPSEAPRLVGREFLNYRSSQEIWNFVSAHPRR